MHRWSLLQYYWRVYQLEWVFEFFQIVGPSRNIQTVENTSNIKHSYHIQFCPFIYPESRDNCEKVKDSRFVFFLTYVGPMIESKPSILHGILKTIMGINFSLWFVVNLDKTLKKGELFDRLWSKLRSYQVIFFIMCFTFFVLILGTYVAIITIENVSKVKQS